MGKKGFKIKNSFSGMKQSLRSKAVRNVAIRIGAPKSDTCFCLVTWEGVVQKIYRQGD
jgi:hypothetical protein